VTISVSTCPTCGASLKGGAVACDYCHSSLVWDGAVPPAPSRSVEEAATAWGRSVLGAPRNLGRLIRSVEVRDEVLERLVTTVARRDVQEVRGRGATGRTTAAPINILAVDPFAVTPEQLRASSQHLATCAVCRGSGTSICRACSGGGRAQCGNCSGSGQERRYYKKSSRLVKCTVCRGGGTVVCGGCGARGRVGCEGCGATGNQLAWLTYSQSERALLFVTDSAVLPGHPQLSERRHLAASELSAFGVMANVAMKGPLPQGIDSSPVLLSQHWEAIDHRLERVTSQQYLRLAVVRRDAKFEMAGVTGRLVLSGGGLAGSTGRRSLRPVRIRLILWGIASLVILLASMAFLAGRHALPYFASANARVGVFVFLGLVLSVPSLGILLRQLRPGLKLGRLLGFEKALVVAAVGCFVGAGIIGKLAHPRVAEVEQALAAKDVSRARVVLDALLAVGKGEVQVVDAQDKVELAEAALQPLEAKLGLLDGIAARKGNKASDATRMARGERLAVVTSALNAGTPLPALKAIERWFADSWTSDVELRELRAQAEQLLLSACQDQSCRFAAASRANGAAATPQRAAQLAEARQAVLASVQFAPVANEPVAARLVRLRQLAAAAVAARSVAKTEPEIAMAAERALAFANDERSHVPLLGAAEEVVVELVGTLIKKTNAISYAQPGTSETFVVFDAQRRCRGIYLVGTQPKSRGIASVAAVSLLSQAVGRPATLKLPTGTGAAATVSRWFEGGIAVVARWNGSALVELRIGDAAP
jgi:hypothetical protein